MKPKNTKKFWNQVYDILVQECQAIETDRSQFVLHQMTDEAFTVREWRFGGSLGFGGKFWRECGETYVSCYREDVTPSRQLCIEKANKRLDKLTGL